MEKRALLAFALSLLVLVLWESFYGGLTRKPRNPAPESVHTVPTDSSATVQPGPPAGPTPRAAQAPIDPVPLESLPQEQLILSKKPYAAWVVETPLYTARIAATGGRLESFQLKRHRMAADEGSPPMEMISTRASGYLPGAVDLLHHPDWQTSLLPFSSDAPKTIRLEGDEKHSITFSAEIPGVVRIEKAFVFSAETYSIDLETRVVNLSGENLAEQLGISFYAVPFGTAGEENGYNTSQLTRLSQGTLEHYKPKDLVKEAPTFEPPLTWVGYQNNYFLQALVPVGEGGYRVVPRLLDEPSGLVQIAYVTDPFQVGTGGVHTVPLRLYFGPKELSRLEAAGHQLERAVDFGWFTFLAKPALQLLKWLYNYLGNYGLAIIVLTVFIKLLFWPLTHKSFKSMQVMKKIQPKMAQIREKYKDDREKLNQELMMLYRTYKVNPLGGCLPMVLQIPVFFALYRMLYGAIELRHQPFCLWINDLTAPDRLSVGFQIPYLGGLPVLTLLMGASMFVQQKMTPASGDPRQEKIMLMLPVVFTVFFINFPSGLVLYWLVNNILSIVQQYWINRQAS